jgi:hypothetical protein
LLGGKHLLRVPHRDGEIQFCLDGVKLKLHALELRADVVCYLSAKVADAQRTTGEHTYEKEDETHKKDQHVNYALLSRARSAYG